MPLLEIVTALILLLITTLIILNKIKFKKEDVVVVCLSGRGDKDMATYMKAME